MSYRPTPPPSVKSSASSREASPPRLPPLSRFFPSRYTADPTLAEGDEEEEPRFRKEKGGSDWETSFKREFLQLTEAARQLSSSPTALSVELTAIPMTPPAADHIRLPAALTSPSPSLSPSLFHAHLAKTSAHRNLPVRRETHVVSATRGSGDSGFEEALPFSPVLSAGLRLKSTSASLTLVRTLGEGAFSSVWLAEDDRATLSPPVYPKNTCKLEAGLRRKSSSWAKRRSDAHMQGLKPTPPVLGSTGLMWEDSERQDGDTGSAEDSVLLDEQDGEGASALPGLSVKNDELCGRVVAVKMMNRALCDANDRTRISFVREVEVLRHIAHPSIVAYLHSFTTNTHHCLVLEYVGGGELFNLVNSDVQYARVTEPAVRRMWGELCRAVGWMHGVSLVHRDIKLENILLTRNIFAHSEPLPPLYTPLIKLTDFGLSRFIDPVSPLLSTRCGSESYAAPELVLGASMSSTRQSSEHGSETSTPANGASQGYYDGRQTDAWACGVVLYALATRQLPFDAAPPSYFSSSAAPSRTGSMRSTRSANSGSVLARTRAGAASRRRDLLMRIAQCEYYWPDEYELEDSDGDNASTCALEGGEGEADGEGGEAEDEISPVATARRLASLELKDIVRRLLERSPARRSRLLELWREPWLRGEGAPAAPLRAQAGSVDAETEEVEETGGMLLDEEHIDSVARQELEPM